MGSLRGILRLYVAFPRRGKLQEPFPVEVTGLFYAARRKDRLLARECFFITLLVHDGARRSRISPSARFDRRANPGDTGSARLRPKAVSRTRDFLAFRFRKAKETQVKL